MATRQRPAWIDDRLYPFKDNWLKVDGHDIHYIDEGASDAPVLLFLHPGPGWSFLWRNHIQALRGVYRCIAPDFPGYGLSTAKPGYTYTLGEQAASLEGFVKALDLRGITMWGNDGGGGTGMLVAARHPDRFAAFVVGGTFAWSFEQYPKVARFLRIVSSRPVRWINRKTNFLAKTQRKLAFGTRNLTKAEGDHYRLAFATPESRDGILRLFRSFIDEPQVGREIERGLPPLRDRPVLILFGEKDPMTKEGWAARWAKEFPNSTTHLLPKVEHFPFEDAPELTLQLFQNWNTRRADTLPARKAGANR